MSVYVKHACNGRTYGGDLLTDKWAPNVSKLTVRGQPPQDIQENYEASNNQSCSYTKMGQKNLPVLSLQDPSNPWSYKAFYNLGC